MTKFWPDMSQRAAAAEVIRRLAAAGVPTPDVESELILAFVTGSSRGETRLAIALDRQLSAHDVEKLESIVAAREDRIPLQHLTGVAPFRHLELRVGPGVFIPRPETEVLVERALHHVTSASAKPVVFDLCTGSAAIALAIATESPQTRVYAFEKDPYAAAWAKRNILTLAPGRIDLIETDITTLVTDPPPKLPGERSVDLIVSNPPYVPEAMVPVDAEVRDHDPAVALYSGADGLDLIRRISVIGAHYIRPGGWIAIEHAEEQGKAVQNILLRAGWNHATTLEDFTGRDRVTEAQYPENSEESTTANI